MADKPRRLNDLQAFFDSMQPVRVTRDGEYTPEDRLRDFRAVFFGTDAGKRVLHQIIAEAEGLPVNMGQLDSHPYLAFRAGKREVGLRIVQWMQAQPADPVIEVQDGDE